MSDSRESALAPLRAAHGALAVLRGKSGDPAEERSAILQVADAVESALRRLLRDDESAPLPLRLRALAPDELAAEALIAELRQRDRISIELAASFHDLLRTRRHIVDGAEATSAAAEAAIGVADRAEREVLASSFSSPPPTPVIPDPASRPVFVDDEELVHPVPPPGSTSRRASSTLWVVLGMALLLLLAATVLWWSNGRKNGGEGELAQGIALFRSGEMVGAAPYFRRYAESHPEDPTPHLYLARIHRRAGRFDEARDELRQALALAPDDPAPQRELGFLLLDAGQHEAATQRFRSAVELDPESTEAWIGLIRALRASGRTDAADRVLSQAPAAVRALVQK
jgi:tetratricopeptide (TPR) repeat protein